MEAGFVAVEWMYVISSSAFRRQRMNWLEKATAAAVEQVDSIAASVQDFPHVTEKKRWTCTSDGVWTGGFWAGLLWLAQEHQPGPARLARAHAFTQRLLPRAHDAHNHDLGFMFFPSAVKGWQLTGHEEYRLAAMQAAASLAAQFNARGGFIPGWGFFGGEDWRGSVLIDTLMNLPLLVWAVQQGAAPSLMEVVRTHTATSLANHLRPNGSVYHVFKFDPDSGAPQGGDTYQGKGPESAWARGQAWALTGLALLAGRTHDAAYTAASRKVAEFFLSALPPDHVPYWDFDVSGAGEPRDASAGAIASYGLQKLFDLTGERRYLDAAAAILQALAATCANTPGAPGGVLLHATADLPHGLGIDESTMYGDYYYLKSLAALRSRIGRP
jgi:unsaturated chondroitin disaccharide hydrolase